ncbi:Gfo/Idh/MocA family protein [Bacillus niameyensis]|uniref:Gfo/Idh/MocA family protein n=1 Tax=Bacillus niameyensis TaxID=1522308 RepID=UPI000A6D8FEE|nr:Gfo/Idh/MocA family oxidoreductase [Bacillus niameyensis]
MVAACAKAGVILVEAYKHRHQPRLVDIKSRIENGEIGDIRGIHGVFTFDSSQSQNNIRFTKEWGGGSIYDIGCYPISTARFILDEEPSAVTAHAFFSPEHGNVDMMASGLMEFSNGVALTFDCAMWAAGRNELEILGSRGRFILNHAFLGDQSYTIVKNGVSETIPDENINQYKLQADDFADCVLDGKPLKFSYSNLINGIKAVKATLVSAEKQERIIL